MYNAESPTPMPLYSSPLSESGDSKIARRQCRLYTIHPLGRPRCFDFDNQFEVAKFSHRQIQNVQLRLNVYMSFYCLHPPIRGSQPVLRRWQRQGFNFKSANFYITIFAFEAFFNVWGCCQPGFGGKRRRILVDIIICIFLLFLIPLLPRLL